MTEPLIFEYDSVNRDSFIPTSGTSDLPAEALRQDEPVLPRASELEVVRHYSACWVHCVACLRIALRSLQLLLRHLLT